MEYKPDIEYWLKFAKAKQIKARISNSLLDRILRRFGLDLVPALFWPPSLIFLLMTPLIAALWGIPVAIFDGNGEFTWRLLLTSLLAGALVATGPTILHMVIRRKHNLTTWAEFRKANGLAEGSLEG